MIIILMNQVYWIELFFIMSRKQIEAVVHNTKQIKFLDRSSSSNNNNEDQKERSLDFCGTYNNFIRMYCFKCRIYHPSSQNH